MFLDAFDDELTKMAGTAGATLSNKITAPKPPSGVSLGSSQGSSIGSSSTSLKGVGGDLFGKKTTSPAAPVAAPSKPVAASPKPPKQPGGGSATSELAAAQSSMARAGKTKPSMTGYAGPQPDREAQRRQRQRDFFGGSSETSTANKPTPKQQEATKKYGPLDPLPPKPAYKKPGDGSTWWRDADSRDAKSRFNERAAKLNPLMRGTVADAEAIRSGKFDERQRGDYETWKKYNTPTRNKYLATEYPDPAKAYLADKQKQQKERGSDMGTRVKEKNRDWQKLDPYEQRYDNVLRTKKQTGQSWKDKSKVTTDYETKQWSRR